MLFNTKEYEWSDVTVILAGRMIVGFRGVAYTSSQEKEMLYGKGNKPHSMQTGNKSYSGTVTLTQSELEALEKAAGGDALDASFNMIVSYGNPSRGRRHQDGPHQGGLDNRRYPRRCSRTPSSWSAPCRSSHWTSRKITFKTTSKSHLNMFEYTKEQIRKWKEKYGEDGVFEVTVGDKRAVLHKPSRKDLSYATAGSVRALTR